MCLIDQSSVGLNFHRPRGRLRGGEFGGKLDNSTIHPSGRSESIGFRPILIKGVNMEVGKASASSHNPPNPKSRMEPMVKALGFVVTVSLLSMPLCANAQGVSQQSNRGGSVGSTSPGAASTSSNSIPSAGAPRTSAGQSRSEGALGLTPQHQKELGISKQQ